jgi:hypothetical protein
MEDIIDRLMFSSRLPSLTLLHDEHDEHALGPALFSGQITPPLQLMPAAVMHPVPVGQFELVMQPLHDGL